MSGIFGVAGPNRISNIQELVQEMSGAMSHREWFVAEHFIEEEHNLAIGRIGIGIFNKDPQPVWDSERTAAVVMVGEIYNREGHSQG